MESKGIKSKGRGRFWNQVESKGKKRRGWNPMGIRVWWTKCKRKKKRRKRMDERKAKNKKSQFKILPQYFYNKF